MTKLVPSIPITDPRFAWVPSHHTNIRARFDAVRAEQRARTEQREREASEQRGHLVEFANRRHEG